MSYGVVKRWRIDWGKVDCKLLRRIYPLLECMDSVFWEEILEADETANEVMLCFTKACTGAEACIEFPVPVSWTKEKAEIFLREIVWKLATM